MSRPQSQSNGYVLKFISGKYQGGEFPLEMGEEIVIGRSSELDMVLVEDMVSRRHARITAENGELEIEDFGSTNGTFVNGKKIKTANLEKGDRILIGTSIIKLVDQEEAGEEASGLEEPDQPQQTPGEQPREQTGAGPDAPSPVGVTEPEGMDQQNPNQTGTGGGGGGGGAAQARKTFAGAAPAPDAVDKDEGTSPGQGEGPMGGEPSIGGEPSVGAEPSAGGDSSPSGEPQVNRESGMGQREDTKRGNQGGSGGATLTGSISGLIEEVPLPDLLQLFSTSQKSGVLVVHSNDVGKVYLRDGRVYYATINEDPDISPHKAFYRMLSWEEGTFSLEQATDESFENEIDESIENLLMEGMRQLDEIRNLGDDVPDLQAELVVNRPLVPPLRSLTDELLDTLQLVFNYSKVSTVLNKSLASDLETMQDIVHLLRKDYIEAQYDG